MNGSLGVLPESVTLCAISYRVTCSEGMVLFSEEDRCGPCFVRLAFTRCAGCWDVEISSSSGRAMVSHIIAAQSYLDKWFGGNHKFKNGENEP